MSNFKNIGIILIICGLFLPSVSYPFTQSNPSAMVTQALFGLRGVRYEPRLNELEIVFKQGVWKIDTKDTGHFEGRIAVPYHFVAALGIIVMFVGIALLALNGKRRRLTNPTP